MARRRYHFRRRFAKRAYYRHRYRRRRLYRRRYHHRHRRYARRFKREFKRRFFNPHPGSYTVRRTKPYDTLSVLFQGVIFVPLGVQRKTSVEQSYRLVTRIHLSLGNMFRAAWCSKPKESFLGGPMYTQEEAHKADIRYPTEWWRWAWLNMIPTFGGRDGTVIATPFPKDHNILDWFARYQLFRHVKTQLSVLNTWQGPFTTTGPIPETSVLASLLVQDSYMEPYTDNNTLPQLGEDIYYWSFGELTARGAPWAFPPGQRGSKGGLMNHHSMTGTNDPMADPWQPLYPNPDMETMAAQKWISQIDKVIGTLHMAWFNSICPSLTTGTAAAPALSGDLMLTTALIRLRSKWLLGNIRPDPRFAYLWPGKGYKEGGEAHAESMAE